MYLFFSERGGFSDKTEEKVGKSFLEKLNR